MQETDWQKAAIRLSEKFPRAFPREISEKLAAAGAGAAIAVACSGGADSLCALLLAWAKFPEARERLVALHFDHAVRKESAEDAEFVREVCGALGVGFVCERLDSSARRGKSEGALRAARLDFFERAMRERGAKILVQGHQRDDVAETMLMRLARGAGTGGLCAPRPVSPQADGRIFARPLLDFPKEKIVAALRECGIPWREDSTNAGTDYFRNRVRNRILPELRAAAPFENFARSRSLLEEDADALDFLAERLMGEAASCRFREDAGTPDGKISSESLEPKYAPSENQLPRASGGTPLLPSAAGRLPSREYSFAKAKSFFGGDAGTPPVLRAIARRMLHKIFAAEKIPLHARLADALVEAVRAGTPLRAETAGTRISLSAAGTLAFSEKKAADADAPAARLGAWTREVVEITPEIFARIRAGEFSPAETVFLAGTPEIFVRAWRPGERYRPLGAPGEKTLGDAFTDRKIPEARRKTLPVFADAAGAAWVPGLLPAERFRILAAGGKALRLTYAAETLPLL